MCHCVLFFLVFVVCTLLRLAVNFAKRAGSIRPKTARHGGKTPKCTIPEIWYLFYGMRVNIARVYDIPRAARLGAIIRTILIRICRYIRCEHARARILSAARLYMSLYAYMFISYVYIRLIHIKPGFRATRCARVALCSRQR